jgi:DNA (cytosine-5)-methyltransferase 1
MPYKFIDLFAGIGGIRLGFERNGMERVFSSEWDKAAQDTYEANFGERPHGDITKIDASDIPDHDILTGGFPCQPFSIIGEGKGFSDTRGTLFFDIERILKEKRPRAFMLENVKQLRSHDQGRTLTVIIEHLEDLGYKIQSQVLNGLDYGVPQKRERIIIVGFLDDVEFSFPEKNPNAKRPLIEILEPDSSVEPKHFLSEAVRLSVQERAKKPYPVPSIWHENEAGNIGIHEFSCALRAGASYNYLTVNGVRRLTPREMLRLQGFPDSFKIVVPDTQIRKQCGNSVVVPKIQAVAEAIKASLMAFDAANSKLAKAV